MEKPTNKQIQAMSTTLLGALKASLWKWQWMCRVKKGAFYGLREPACGLCFYVKGCPECPLKSCGYSSLYTKACFAESKLESGKITLSEYREVARKLRDRIKKLYQAELKKQSV